uniref:NR LBD domain-containing protein n=1 Tax=Ditylenchus dipsaci TaxID=166011 RepID=A0A915D5N4_9BILA
MDYAEYVLLKAIIFFREEVGLSPTGMAQVREARTKYLRALFKYIRREKENTQNSDENRWIGTYTKRTPSASSFERISSILALVSVISSLKSVTHERFELSHIFNIIQFDGLINEVHNIDLEAK